MLRHSLAIAVFVLLAPNCWAIEFGWEALSDGGIEYVVQVEPELISTFQEQGYTSAIPQGLRDIRRIRIQVGSGKLPNHGDLIGPQPATDSKAEGSRERSAKFDQPPLVSKGTEPSATDTTKSPEVGAKNNASTVEKSPWLGGAAGDRPPLPFFQTGPLKRMSADGSDKNETADNSQAPAAERTDKPRLNSDEGIATPVAHTESGNQMVRADKPASGGVDLPSIGVGGDTRPWLLLMLILITLFASVAGNVYLAWIYQTARGQYRLLAKQLSQPRAG